MRLILMLVMLFAVQSSFAESKRSFFCLATDRVERQYELEYFVDARTIVVKSAVSSSSQWEVIYGRGVDCGLQRQPSENCEHRLINSITSPSLPLDTASGSFKCKRANGKMIVEKNGYFKIENGIGFLQCGVLPKHDLKLENCQTRIDR